MKNKGFTVIELLVSFVIVALIAAIGIISYNAINKKVETSYYKTLEESLLLSGNEYFQAHREELPIHGSRSVSVENLVNGRYIEPIKDKNGNACTKGDVYIYRNSETNTFDYEVCLECGSYKSEGVYCGGQSGEIDVDAVLFGTSTKYNTSLSYTNVGVTQKDVSATFSLSDNDTTIIVSRYVIKNADTGTVIKELTNIDNSANKNQCTYVFKNSGRYIVTAYSGTTQVADEKEVNVKIDNEKPKFDIEAEKKYMIEDDQEERTIKIKLKNVRDNFGIGSISYCYNYKKECYTETDVKKPDSWSILSDINSNTIEISIGSGSYTLYVEVADLAGNVEPGNVSFDVSYLVKLLYNDNYVQKHEVITGKTYGYLDKLPTAYENKPIIWYYASSDDPDNPSVISDDTSVLLTSEHTLTTGSSSKVDKIKESEYCLKPSYNGENQLLTKKEPTGVIFSSNIQKEVNQDGYPITVNLLDGYVWSDNNGKEERTIYCPIFKSDTTTTLTAQNNPYTGTIQEISGATSTLSSNNSAITDGGYTYTYYNGDSCSGTALSVAPIDTGTYSVKATLAGTSNYNSSTSSCTIYTIGKISVTASLSSCENKVYDGNKNATCTLGTTTGIIESDDVNVSLGTCTFNNAKAGNNKKVTCTVSLDGGDKDNYALDPPSITKNANITKRTVTITEPEVVSADLKYNGSNQNLLLSAGSCSTGGVMYWYPSNPTTDNTAPEFSTSTWTTNIPSTYNGNAAGTYYIWYYCYVSDTANNTGTNINTVLNKPKTIGSNQDIITVSKQTFTYDGIVHTTSVSTTSNLTPTITYYVDNKCNNVTTSANSGAASNGAAPVNANTYYVIATTEGNSNYEAGNSSCTEALVISKAVCTLTTTNQTIKTGNELNLSEAASNVKGTLSYALKSDGNNTTTPSTISNGILVSGAMSSDNDDDQSVDVMITDSGNNNYAECSKPVVITVQKNTNTMTRNNKTVYVNSVTALSGLVKDNIGGELSAVKGTDNEGGTKGSVSGTNFNAGTLSASDDSNKTVSLSITAASTTTVKAKTVTTTVTVKKYTRDLTLTVDPLIVRNGNTANLSITNGGSGGTPGTNITYTSSNTNVFTVNGETITAVASSGTSDITATRSGSETVKAATSSSVTVEATYNTFTINYYLGKGTSSAGNDLLGTSTCTYGQSCTLSSYASFNKDFRETSHGWGFAYWSLTQTSLDKAYEDSQSFTYNLTENLNLYAVGVRTVSFATGISPTNIAIEELQYWIPYTTSTNYATAVDIPDMNALKEATDNAADIGNGWELRCFRANDKVENNCGINSTYNGGKYKIPVANSVSYRTIYQRNVTIEYDGNGNTGGTVPASVTLDQQQYYNSGYPYDGVNTGGNLLTLSFTLSGNTGNLVKTGYTYGGWSETTNGTVLDETLSFKPAVDASANKKVYAKWTANSVTVNIRNNDETWTSNGIKVALYQNGTLVGSFEKATSSSSSVTFTAVPEGTYNIYASYNSGATGKTMMRDTGKTVTVGSSGTDAATIDYYTITRNAGGNTNLITRYETSTGSTYTSTNLNFLKGVTIYIEAGASTGYILTFTVGGDNKTSPYTHTVTEAATIETAGTLNTYTVTFASSNNNCTLNATTYANINATYGSNIKSSAIANPTCSGYTFTGWTASGDINTGTAKYGTSSSPATAWIDGNKGTYFKNLSTTNNGTVTLTAGWEANDINITYDYNRGSYTYNASEYTDTKYMVNWNNDFTINTTVNVPSLGNRYMFFNNYGSTSSTSKDLSVEINTSNKIIIWINGARRATSTGTVAANTDINVVFTWTASSQTYTVTTTGTNSNTSISGTYDVTGSPTRTLRIGAKDHRTSSSPYEGLTVKSFSIIEAMSYGGKLTNLPTGVSSAEATFDGWYTAATNGTAVTTNTDIPSSDTTYYAHWTKNSYTATFYYYNGTAVTSTTQQCTISSSSTCSVSIPQAVTGSKGTYSNAYYGLSTSTKNMTVAIDKNATSISLNANATYYALYSSEVTINYPTNTSAKASVSAYRNQWLSSKTAMATTVLSTTETGTSSDYSFTSSVDGYSLYGFATSASTNESTYNSVASLKNSSATEAYAILSKSVTATFYYSKAITGTVGSATSANANQYIRCTSSGAEISNSTITVPSITEEILPTGTARVEGWSKENTSMTIASTIDTSNLKYYAVYQNNVTIYKPSSTSACNTTNTIFSRNAYINIVTPTVDATTYTVVLATSSTGTENNASYTPYTGYNLLGFATARNNNTTSYATLNALRDSDRTIAYAVLTKEESENATLYYSNSYSGAKTSTTTSGTKTTYLKCTTSNTKAGTSVVHGSCTLPTSPTGEKAPYGTDKIDWSSETNSVSVAETCTTGNTYYRIYQSALTIYYPTSTTISTSKDDVLYRIGILNSADDTSFTRRIVNGAESVTQLTNANITNSVLTNMYGTFKGLATAVNSSNVSNIDASGIVSPTANTKTYYVVTTGNTYNITFNVNGNGGSNSNESCTETTVCTSTSGGATKTCNITAPQITVPTNFALIGWSSSQNSHTNNWSPGETKTASANGTYYAQTIAGEEHTITFIKGSKTLSIIPDGCTSTSTGAVCTCDSRVYNGAALQSCEITSPTFTSSRPYVSYWISTNSNNKWDTGETKIVDIDDEYTARSCTKSTSIVDGACSIDECTSNGNTLTCKETTNNEWLTGCGTSKQGTTCGECPGYFYEPCTPQCSSNVSCLIESGGTQGTCNYYEIKCYNQAKCRTTTYTCSTG